MTNQAEQAKQWFQEARALCNADGTPSNPERYFLLMQQAAQAGHSNAMAYLGRAYYQGYGTPIDLVTSFDWTLKAAEAGITWAMWNVAVDYRNGLGVPKNIPQYAYWVRRAAESNSRMAMYNLGLDYRNGRGVEIDLAQSLFWVSKAATAGHRAAMFDLGNSYEEGRGVDVDLKQFVFWTRKAADLGDAAAMWNLSWAYGNGRGVKRSKKQHIEWQRRAAAAGDQWSLWFEARRVMHHPRHGGPAIQAWAKQDGAFKHLLERAGVDAVTQKALYLGLARLFLDVGQHKLDHHKVTDTPAGIAHFTSHEVLNHLLPFDGGKVVAGRNRLRLYHASYMNDPDEGRYLLKSLRQDEPDLFGSIFDAALLDKDHDGITVGDTRFGVYLCSLTLETDRLDLWRAYGKDGSGISLELPPALFTAPEIGRSHLFHRDHEGAGSGADSPASANTLLAVRYGGDDAGEDDKKAFLAAKSMLATHMQALANCMAKVKDVTVRERAKECIHAIVADLLYLYKDPQYRTEREVRLVYACTLDDPYLKLDERKPGRLYVETQPVLFTRPGHRVVIGPKASDKQEKKLEAEYRLSQHKMLANAAVVFSKVGYR
jgi:TPR repeat protein